MNTHREPGKVRMNTHREPGEVRMNTHREPRKWPLVPASVRRWAYGIAAAGAPLATIYGLTTEHQSVLWLNLIGAVLFTMAVGNTPTRRAEQVPEDADQ